MIGTSLFSRTPRGIRLNEAGERFLRHARQAVRQVDDAGNDAAANGRGETGTVRIGIVASFASAFVTDLFRSYEAGHPNVGILYVEKDPAELIAAIRQRQIDIAFLVGTPDAPDCETAILWNERAYVAMAESDGLAGREVVGWQDIRDRRFVVTEAARGPQIRAYLTRRLAALGATPLIETQAVYRDTLMQMVASGGKLTLVIESYTALSFPGVVYRPLADELIPLSAVWSADNENPAFRRLLSLAKSISRKLSKP